MCDQMDMQELLITVNDQTYVKVARPSTRATEKKSRLASMVCVFNSRRPLFVSGRQTIVAVSWSKPPCGSDSAT